jgi:hypothetical protein
MIHEAFLSQEYGDDQNLEHRAAGKGPDGPTERKRARRQDKHGDHPLRLPGLSGVQQIVEPADGAAHQHGGVRTTAPHHVRFPEDRVQRQCDRKEEGVIAHLNASHRRRQSSSPPGSPDRTQVFE